MGEKFITPDKLTRTYIKIRAERSLLSAKFKEEDDKLSRQLDRVKQAMLEHCERNNEISVRTVEGLFFKSERTKYWVSDWSEMHNFIKENSIPELLENRVSQKNVREYLADNPTKVPDGLNTEKEVVISVRKK